MCRPLGDVDEKHGPTFCLQFNPSGFDLFSYTSHWVVSPLKSSCVKTQHPSTGTFAILAGGNRRIPPGYLSECYCKNQNFIAVNYHKIPCTLFNLHVYYKYNIFSIVVSHLF